MEAQDLSRDLAGTRKEARQGRGGGLLLRRTRGLVGRPVAACLPTHSPLAPGPMKVVHLEGVVRDLRDELERGRKKASGRAGARALLVAGCPTATSATSSPTNGRHPSPAILLLAPGFAPPPPTPPLPPPPTPHTH